MERTGETKVVYLHSIDSKFGLYSVLKKAVREAVGSDAHIQVVESDAEILDLVAGEQNFSW